MIFWVFVVFLFLDIFIVFLLREVVFVWNILLFFVFCFEIGWKEEIFCCWDRNGFWCVFFDIFVDFDEGVLWWFFIEGVCCCFVDEVFLLWNFVWLLKFSCCLEDFFDVFGRDFNLGFFGVGVGVVGKGGLE